MGLTVGVLSTVVGGLILAGVLYLIGRVWQDNPITRRRDRRQTEADARRLLKEFQRRADRDHNYIVATHWAARHAGVEDPGPAVAMLKEWGLIEDTEQGAVEMFVRVTPEGLRAGENAV